MTGKIIVEGQKPHRCDKGSVPKDPSQTNSDTHHPHVEPGAVWQCECGKTWVCTTGGEYNWAEWRRETRGEAKRRRKQTAITPGDTKIPW